MLLLLYSKIIRYSDLIILKSIDHPLVVTISDTQSYLRDLIGELSQIQFIGTNSATTTILIVNILQNMGIMDIDIENIINNFNTALIPNDLRTLLDLYNLLIEQYVHLNDSYLIRVSLNETYGARMPLLEAYVTMGENLQVILSQIIKIELIFECGNIDF